uniref:Protease inhibitor n=2 Tax=Rhodnius prolixus TaxID=13249 RepID=T1IGC2_RHOPR
MSVLPSQIFISLDLIKGQSHRLNKLLILSEDMNLILLLLLVIIEVVFADNNCEPGKPVLLNEGCTSCNCTEQGTIGECVPIACDSKRIAIVKRLLSIKRCAPGVTLDAGDGCNKCICSEKGVVADCTRMACPGVVQSEV